MVVSPARGVLQPDVEPDLAAGRALQDREGAQDHGVAPQEGADAGERVRGQAVGVGEPQLHLGAGHVLAGDDPQPLSGPELAREHLGDPGREPLRPRGAAQVLEPEHRDRTARRDPLGQPRQALLRRHLLLGAPAQVAERADPHGQEEKGGEREDLDPVLLHGWRRRWGSWGRLFLDLRRSGQGLDDIRGRGEARGRVALQAAEDGRLPAGVEAGHVDPRRGRPLLQPTDGHGERGVAHEWHGPGQHLVEDDAEGVDVDRGGDLLALDLLGRQVGGGAHDAGLGGQGHGVLAGFESGEAEVGDDRASRPFGFREHDVARLQVAMDDPGLVGGVEGPGDLPGHGQRLLRGHRAGAPEPLRQGLALQQLHGEEDEAAMEGDVEDAADVRVGDLARELDLAPEPLDRELVAGDVPAHGLERHPLAQLLVLDLVDLAHAAAGQEAEDPVAPRDPLAGSERRLAVGARGRGMRQSGGDRGADERRRRGARHGDVALVRSGPFHAELVVAGRAADPDAGRRVRPDGEAQPLAAPGTDDGEGRRGGRRLAHRRTTGKVAVILPLLAGCPP